jgi:hypothetical protein
MRAVTALLLAAMTVVAVLAFSAPAFAAPDGRGNNTTETRSTGSPDNPQGFGSVTSQRAIDDHDIGAHVSTQNKPHLGLGNNAADDGSLAIIAGVTDTGTRPGDHALIIGTLSGYDPTARPGTHE